MPNESSFFLVVIGASAGGLRALRPIVDLLERRGRTTYVLAQHLSPTHTGNLAEILGVHSALTILGASEGAPLLPDHFYIGPPGYDVLVRDGHLELLPPEPAAFISPSIDKLFISAAESFGGQTVGVILSGSGRDGTAGLDAIREKGGIAIIQAPEDADQAAMPNSALGQPGGCFCGSAEDIARWLNGIETLRERLGEGRPEPDSQPFAELFRLVTQATGLDLGQYKEATLLRQTTRHYQTLGFASLKDYVAHARGNPEELSRLQGSLLISVSCFFRDRPAFAALEKALRESILGKQEGDSIRVWVAGCATGQEAYSVAILLGEILGNRLGRFDVKVFATDIDQEAIEFARAGVYSSEELAELDRERWFSQQGGGWRIKKALRDLCIFSVHDLISHPPFINMDLVTCRNLLIYLKQEQQEALLDAFHYALKPGGLLLLGKSESTGFNSRLFEPIDTHQRLYRRRLATASFSHPHAWFAPPAAPPHRLLARAKPDLAPQSLEESARSVVVRYGPPGVLVNAKFEPLYFFGRSERYFSLPTDNPDFSLFSLCPHELRGELKTLAYRMAWENLDALRGAGVALRFNDETVWAWPVLRRVKLAPDSAEPAFLIYFGESPAGAAGAVPTAYDQADETVRLREELADTREHLEAMIEAMEASNEESQSLNEELQSSGEELQASNEELQASNEELKTLNEALRLKSDELDQANTTLNNIQNSIRTGLVVTDSEGKITRFNALAVRIFGLMAKDIGQLLYGIPCHLDLPQLRDHINGVVTGGETVVQRVHQGDFHYLMQIAPYINELGGRAGAVLTFTDISEMYRAEMRREEAEERFRLFMDNNPAIAWIKDEAGRHVYLNKTYEERFNLRLEDCLGKTDHDMWPPQIAGAFLANDRAALAAGHPLEIDEETLDQDGKRRIWRNCKFPFQDAAGMRYVGGIGTDVTERRQLEQTLALRGLALDAAANAIVIAECDGRIEWANRAFLALSGYSREEVLGRTLRELVNSGQQSREFYEQLWRTIRSGQVWQGELVNRRKDGSLFHECQTITPVRGEDGQVCRYVSIKQDITERKRAEAALQDSERRYRELVQNANSAIIRWSRDGCITFLNEYAQEFFGWRADEIVGKTVGILLPEQASTGTDYSGLVKDIVSHPDRYLNNINENVCRDGRRVWMAWTNRAIHDEQGRVTGILAVGSDITERRQAEEAVRASESRYRSLFDNMLEGFAYCRMVYEDGQPRDFTYLDVNPAFERLTRLRDVIGKNVSEVIPGVRESDPELFTVYGRVAAGGPPERFEIYLSALEMWFSVSVYGVGAGCFVAVFDVITERKRAEEELDRYRHDLEHLVDQRTRQLQEANRTLEERAAEIADLYNNAPCGYHSLNGEGIVIAINDTELAWLGYTREEVEGRLQYGQLIAPDYLPVFREHFLKLRDSGQALDLEIDLVRKDGSRLPVAVRATAMRDSEGRFLHSRATLFDNSERKVKDRHIAQLNAELARRVEEAEAANRAKSAFLANMSHEIRTPMNAILGLTRLLGHELAEPGQRERLAKIQEANHHLLAIINDILDLSKIEAGKLALETVDFSPADLFGQVSSLIHEKARNKGLSLRFDTDELPPVLRGDPTRLRQALLNYLSNAIKFTEQGGIDVKAQVIEDSGADLRVRFEVKDTGIGIEPAHMGRLFSAFEQADNTTTRKYGGTGLGLAITRQLAQLMGGAAGAESEPGRGSTFWFTARLAKCPGRTLPTAPIAKPSTDEAAWPGAYRGVRILLAEDNPINQEVAMEQLRETGLEVDLAENGRQAVEMAMRIPYALILMDMQMPEMDGLEATRAIRRLPEHRATPILAMTANAFGEDRSACLEAGMNDHIAKPVEPDVLRDRLTRWLSPRVGVAPNAPPPGAGETGEAAWLACLRTIPGLDITLGLTSVHGKLHFYHRLLRRFAETHSSEPARLRERLAAGDLVGARQLAHSLKGASATLGASRVQAAAARLELAIKEGQEGNVLLERIENLDAELQPLVEAITALSM